MPVYLGIFKEPRGFIRILQFIFAIFAFGTACSGSSYLSIKDGNNVEVVNAAWSYPYDLTGPSINPNLNSNQTSLSSSNSIKPSAQFFVFTGVTSMLLSLAFAVFYVFLDRAYRNNERIPIVDLIIALIWTIFWIASSSAWAQGVSDIRLQTSNDYVSNLVNCNSTICVNYDSGSYANVIVSVVFGFLNFVLWFGSIWFVYKETIFYRNRSAQQNPQQNNFSNIQQQQQQAETRMPGTMN